jgi:hypothetical protein
MADGTNSARAARHVRFRPMGWDPYDVWRILVRAYPVHNMDPSGSVGRIEAANLPAFLETIADYPDYLQDALLVIAHAHGVVIAGDVLDQAIRQHLGWVPGR